MKPKKIEIKFFDKFRNYGTVYFSIKISYEKLDFQQRASLINSSWWRNRLMYRNVFNYTTGEYIINCKLLRKYYKKLTIHTLFRNIFNSLCWVNSDEINLLPRKPDHEVIYEVNKEKYDLFIKYLNLVISPSEQRLFIFLDGV